MFLCLYFCYFKKTSRSNSKTKGATETEKPAQPTPTVLKANNPVNMHLFVYCTLIVKFKSLIGLKLIKSQELNLEQELPG